EWKQQASIRGQQYRATEETKQKISATLMGHSFTPEAIQKMSDTRQGKYIGEANPFFGRHHSEESKRKNADAHRKPWSEKRRAAYERTRLVAP
ncbi:MAG: NUMOD3 domain-containing DNA-binding protein, partial [Burkholderiales bacterium]